MEPAIDQVVQQERERLQYVLDAEAEAKANIQSLGYPTWARADFLPSPSQDDTL